MNLLDFQLFNYISVSCLIFLVGLALALVREDALGQTRGLGKTLNQLMYSSLHFNKDICLYVHFWFIFHAYVSVWCFASLYNCSHLTVVFSREFVCNLFAFNRNN